MQTFGTSTFDVEAAGRANLVVFAQNGSDTCSLRAPLCRPEGLPQEAWNELRRNFARIVERAAQVSGDCGSSPRYTRPSAS